MAAEGEGFDVVGVVGCTAAPVASPLVAVEDLLA